MKQLPSLLIPLAAGLILSACGGGDSKPSAISSSSVMSSASSMASSMAPPSSAPASSMAGLSSVMPSTAASSMAAMVTMKYSVTITNLTAGQPLSPVGYILHKPSYSAFSLGMSASPGLEKLAEGGDASDLLTEAAATGNTYMSAKGSSAIMPGTYQTLTISQELMASYSDNLHLTLLTMPVNTNDGFTGLNGVNIGRIGIGESMTYNTTVYDAGTEMNSETITSVPGPAAGGEGFNSLRDDIADQVTMHPGVVTMDDGKVDSALTQLHRWDNPVTRITITRLAP